MQEKICTKCGKTLDVCEYHKDSKGKFGLRSWCKLCEKKRNKESNKSRYATHKETKSLVYYNGRANKLKQRAIGNVTGQELKALMAEHNHECEYCKSPKNLQFDHIVSVDNGGRSDLANLAVLCETCNRMKGKLSHNEFISLLKIIIANSERTIPSEA